MYYLCTENVETKTIAVDREAYEILRTQKRRGESFSDVIKRVAAKRRPLTDFAGLWKTLPKDELKKVEDAIARMRELDRERLERLLKRVG